MKSTQSQYVNKKQPILNQPYKENSFSFLAQCHRDRPIKTVNDSFQLNRLKKSYKKKLNLHQIKIQVDSLCQQKDKNFEIQSHIINQLNQHENQFSYLNMIKSQKSQSFKRQLKTLSQNRKDTNTEVKQNCHSLFNEGFLPDVKKFYSTYKNIQRQNERVSFQRNSLSGNELRNHSFTTLKLAQIIKQYQIAPRKVGMLGSKYLDKINSNSAHLTKKQYRILTKGMSLAEVHKIGLSNNRLSKQSASMFVKNLPQIVEKLNLKSTIKSKDILQLLDSQPLKQGRLKKLNLSFNKITDTGLKYIQQVFSHNLTLEILNLSNNFITDQSINILTNFIKENQNLRNLNLAWNQFAGKNIYIFFDAVESSKLLINLNLSRNKIGDSLSDIISNVSKNKQNLQLKNQNYNHKQYSSLISLCRMLQNNKYLLHFDLSYNKIQNKDCQKIAQYTNLFNQTLVGFHIQGNSNYFQNQFGFLVNNGNIIRDIQLTGSNLLNDKKIKRVQKKQKKYTYTNFDQQKSIDRLSEKCWLCLGWGTKKFTFEIDRKSAQLYQALKDPFSDLPISNQIIKNVYIHLECYNYQPVLMQCKKKIKSGLIDRILQRQRSLKTLNVQTQTINKQSKDKKNETWLKSKKKLISNTVTNLSFQNKNFNSLKDDQQIVIHCYWINLKIPSNKKLKYFFTIDGQPFIDKKSQSQKVKFGQIPVQFSLFNPLQQILSSKVQERKSKQTTNQNINQAFQFFQSLIGTTQNQTKQHLNLKLFLSQFNIHNPDKQSDEKQQKSYLEKYLLQKVQKKLLSDNQQLTEQQYNALIKQRIRVQQIQKQGSDKYIQSDKLIQTKQLEFYEEENQNSTFYVKPRYKNLFYGKSDTKSNLFDIVQFFKVFIRYLNDTKDQNASRQFEKFIQKSRESQHIEKSQIFYPFKKQLNTSNDYFNLLRFQKLIQKQKIQIDSFNRKVLKINHFKNIVIYDEHKNSNYIKDTLKDILFEQQQKIKLSQILPYVLVSYQSAISNRKNQNLNQNQFGIFSKLESKSRKKIPSKSKRTKSKISQKKIQASKQSQQLKTQTLHVSTQQKTKLQSQTQEIKKNQENSIFPQGQKEQLTLNQLNQDQMANIISMKLVQEIFQYKKEEPVKILISKKEQKNTQEKDTFNKFVQKLQAWKQKQILYSTQEKQILSLVNQQINRKLQQKKKKIQEIQKSTKYKSKFNLKINKFCSLQASSPQQKCFENTLHKFRLKQRSTVDFKNQSPQSFNEDFEISFTDKKEDEQVKITFLNVELDQFKIVENTQLFFLFDDIFLNCFNKSSTQTSIKCFIKKINKFLDKKQKTNLNKNDPKTFKVSNNKMIKKELKLNKNFSQKFTQISQKAKIESKNSTKDKFFESKLTQNQETLQQIKVEKNLFLFFKKLKQQSERYFNVKEQIKFPFMQKADDISQVQMDLNDFILRRFDYITLNLINNLDKIKEFKRTLSNQTKQVFLKELLSYRSFLLNSKEINFNRNFQKLVEIIEQKRRKDVKLSQKFIQKMKTINFNGIMDLLNEYILYIVYFLTKLICFLIMSSSQTLIQQFKNQGFQEDKQILKIKKQKNQVILEKDELVEDQIQQKKIEPKKQNQTQKYSLIGFIKNKPERFQQRLEKLIKSVTYDIIITITQLHIKYDQDFKKVKEQKNQQNLQQKNQSNIQNQHSIDQNKSQRNKSIFSRNSSKSLSKDQNKNISSKKIRNNSLRKANNQGQLKSFQPSQKEANLLTIKEKKVKIQKKRPKLSLNRGKKLQ